MCEERDRCEIVNAAQPMASLKHSVAVNVRVRPDGSAPIPFDRFQYPSSVIEGSDQTAMTSALTADLVRKFIRGGTACTLMAYGQTGSGKTYTMFGPAGALTEASLEQAAGSVPATWGAFPRATMQLLQAPELAGATFHASAVEIYMEHAYDLLDGRKPVKVGSAKGSGRGTLVVGDMGKATILSGDVKITGGVHPSGCSCFHCFQKTGGLTTAAARKKQLGESSASAARRPRVPPASKAEASGGEEFGTEGETIWPLQTAADVAKLARLVESERVAHSHALNDRSSRSHCLVRVHCTLVEGGRTQKRLFLFVDLAGSERIKKSEVTGARAKEASSINQSLTALGRVVKELNERSAHVSYRDSALTMLLRASFDGPSCTSVVVNVSGAAEHAEETLCSLRFGEKLASVRTSAATAAPVDVGAQRAKVGAELEAARAKLAGLERDGQGNRINPSAPPSEQATLRANLATLAEREADVRALKAALVEAKASGGAADAIAAKLQAAQAAHTNLHDLVEMQKTVKYRDSSALFTPATPAHRRAEAQVAALAAEMAMLGGM